MRLAQPRQQRNVFLGVLAGNPPPAARLVDALMSFVEAEFEKADRAIKPSEASPATFCQSSPASSSSSWMVMYSGSFVSPYRRLLPRRG